MNTEFISTDHQEAVVIAEDTFPVYYKHPGLEKYYAFKSKAVSIVVTLFGWDTTINFASLYEHRFDPSALQQISAAEFIKAYDHCERILKEKRLEILHFSHDDFRQTGS